MLKSLTLAVSLLALPALAANDGLITTKTKLKLWTTGDVRSTEVHVDTNDGIVTLSGKVNTAEQKTKAEAAARQVKDVRSVKNLLQVVPSSQEKQVSRSDDEIKDTAKQRLKNDELLRKSSIEVKSVNKGVVLLSGKANTLSDHLRAVTLIDQVPGVRRVTSEINAPEKFGTDERFGRNERTATRNDTEPAPATGTGTGTGTTTARKDEAKTSNSFDDMRIASSVKMRLLTTADVPATDINVDSNDRVVYLFGMVPTEAVKSAAASEAAKVDGVTRVENQLSVVPSKEQDTAEAKDNDMKRDLNLAFKNRNELKDVKTMVEGGVVRLTGKIHSEWDELNALRLARGVKGVKSVVNELELDEKDTAHGTDRRY